MAMAMKTKRKKQGRPLCVLGAFQPFGLTVEHWPKEEKSSYTLFDPRLSRRNPDHAEPLPDDNFDEELFIHGNCVIWSAGSEVRKRFSSPSVVIQASWCRFDSIMEPLLCILYSECLATFTPAGEMTIVPLPHAMESLWPVPFGLLLQSGSIGNVLSWNKMNLANECRVGQNSLLHSSIPVNNLNFTHFALQHPLEEPQALQVEEGSVLCGNIGSEEQIVWSSSDVPYVVSYHNVKLQHTIWHVKLVQAKGEFSFESKKLVELHSFNSGATVCLERLWQGEGGKPVADQVFLATDSDGVPILCFLTKVLQNLSAFRLVKREMTNLKGSLTWNISAIAAAPIIATRPWLRQSHKQFDLIILTAEGNLYLHVHHLIPIM